MEVVVVQHGVCHDVTQPEAVAIVRPTDVSKLQALAKKFDQGTEHYTVENIGGWSVVADSAASFQAVRDAGYEPIYAGDLENAAMQESVLGLIFAVTQGGLGPFFYRMTPPGRL